MTLLIPALAMALVTASLLSANALATEPPPKAGAAPPAADRQPTPDPAKAPPTKAAPRRAVRQIIDGMPPPTPPVLSGPRLTPPAPPPTTVQLPPAGAAPAAPAAPAIIGRCDAGGCSDTNGTRYNNGAGNTLLGPQGRVCHQNGSTVQCL